MLKKFEKIVLDHPVAVLLLATVLTVLFAWYLPKVKFSSSSDRFFIEGDPDKEYYEKAKRLFGNDQVVVVAMVAPDGEDIYTASRIEKIRDLTRNIGAIDGIEGVVSLTNVPTISAPRDPETGEFKKSIEVGRLIPGIPETEEGWERLKAEVDRVPLYHKNIVSEDGRATAVVAFVSDFDQVSYRYNQVMAEIYERIDEVREPEKFYTAGVPGTRVAIEERMVEDLKVLLPLTFLLIVVVLILSYRNPRGVLLPLVIIGLTVLWTVSFMEVASIPITLVTMILPPLMVALGSSYSIHMMSEYTREMDTDRTVRQIVSDSVSKVSMPIAVCGVTTIVGFGSLVLNEIPAIRDLGYAAVAGILFAVLIALAVMPASLILLKKPKIKQEALRAGAVDGLLSRLSSFNIHNRRLIFLVAVAAAGTAMYGVTKIKIDTDFLSFFPDDDPIMEAVHAQAKHLAGAAPFNIVLEADRPDVFKHPAMLKRVEELQRYAEEEVYGVDTTISMADYVKLLNQAFHGNDTEYYRVPDDPREVSQMLFLYSTSGSPEDFAPYITMDYSAANILIRSRLVGSTETNRAIRKIEAKARELFKPPEYEPVGRSPAELQVSLPPDPTEETVEWGDGSQDSGEETLDWGEEEESVDWGEDSSGPDTDIGPEVDAGDTLEAINELPAPSGAEFPWPRVQVHVTGTIYLMNKSADAVSKGQVLGLGTALLAIFIVMTILFLSPKIGLLAMLPNLFPIILLFGIMGYSGITLNFSTSLIAAIALGIGVDDTIQYINRYNIEVGKTHDQNESMVNALCTMGKPMVYTSVALFFGFIILTLSDFIPIRQFGLLTAVTLIIALGSNLIILPTLLITVRIVTLWDLLDLEIGENPARYIKLFHGLTNHQAKVAALTGHVIQYEDDEWIFNEGDMGNELYIVIKGYVNIIKKDEGHSVNLYTIHPGDSFGESALLRHTTRSASAKSEGRTRLLVLDEQMLQKLQKRMPRASSVIYYNISRMLSDRLQNTSSQVFECSMELEEATRDK